MVHGDCEILKLVCIFFDFFLSKFKIEKYKVTTENLNTMDIFTKFQEYSKACGNTNWICRDCFNMTMNLTICPKWGDELRGIIVDSDDDGKLFYTLKTQTEEELVFVRNTSPIIKRKLVIKLDDSDDVFECELFEKTIDQEDSFKFWIPQLIEDY